MPNGFAPRALCRVIVLALPLFGDSAWSAPTPSKATNSKASTLPTPAAVATPAARPTLSPQVVVAKPVSTVPLTVSPDLQLAPQLDWDFESSSSVRFSGASSSCAMPGPETLPHGEELSNAIGGSYWQQTYNDGRKNACVLQVTPGTAMVLSPEFSLTARSHYLTFLVGGSEAGAKIEIQQSGPQINSAALKPTPTIPGVTPRATAPVTTTGWSTRTTYTGVRTGGMHRVTMDLASFVSTWTLRLKITVPSGGVLRLDDVRVITTPEAETPAPVWGMADLHTHPFNNIGSGGKLFSGLIHSSIGYRGLVSGGAGRNSDPAVALKACHEEHGTAPDGRGVMTMFLEGGHNANGYPTFEGWPRYYTTTHQQMYVDWLKRAWQGGLRLFHADVGNTSVLGALFAVHPGFGGARNPLDDGWNITTQVQAAHDFARLPDVRDWLEIARTAGEARRIISEGKLAMVLGIEVDDIGNLTAELQRLPSAAARNRRVRDYLNALYANDVRHIIPVHLMENAFGAPAVYESLFSIENFIVNGRFFPTREAFNSGIRMSVPPIDDNSDLMGAILARASLPSYAPVRGIAHAQGLSSNGVGAALIQKMMNLGMIVDVDHMSDLSVDQTLAIAQRFNYPVVSSHTGFRELAFGSWVASGSGWAANTSRSTQERGWQSQFASARTEGLAKERDRSASHLATIRALGGMVGVGTGQGAIPRGWTVGSSAVSSVCDGSTTTFAQEYLYAVDKLGGRGIALGTDANGYNGSSNPRFGPSACALAHDDEERKGAQGTQISAQRSPVAYAPVSASRRFLNLTRARFDQAGDQGGYDGFERQMWHALLLWKEGQATGASPGSSANPDTYDQDFRNVVYGLWLGSSNGHGGTNGPRPTQGFPDTAMHKRLGWDLAACPSPITDARKCAAAIADRDHDLNVYKPKAQKVLTDLNRMLSGTNPRMRKSVTGQADFDINLDGYAHYGMTPDFIQDVQNLGVRTAELRPLFRSAEDYLRMWETIEARRGSVPDL